MKTSVPVLVIVTDAFDRDRAELTLEALVGLEDSLEVGVIGEQAASLRGFMPGLRTFGADSAIEQARQINELVNKSNAEIVAFLAAGAVPESLWLEAARASFESNPSLGAVACRIKCPSEPDLSFRGGRFSWFSQKGLSAKLCPPQGTDQEHDVLFASLAAVFIGRKTWKRLAQIQSEALDSRFLGALNEVDLGWRINLLDKKILYKPQSSVVFEPGPRLLAASDSLALASWRADSAQIERNALYILYLNLGAETLSAVLAPLLTLMASQNQADWAVSQFAKDLPELKQERQIRQKVRQASDPRLWRLLYLPKPEVPGIYKSVVEAFELDKLNPRTRVLIITPDRVGHRMAGPAIRAWNMALILSRSFEVCLLTVSDGRLDHLPAPFRVVQIKNFEQKPMARWEEWANVVIFQGHILTQFPLLKKTRKLLVADVYDPMHLEQLEQAKEMPLEIWRLQVASAAGALEAQFQLADFFICASKRQRFFYLGQLMAEERISVERYRYDADLKNLIDVVPFGLSSDPPVKTRSVLRGIKPEFDADSKILIWGGGLYNWFDPQTLIRAVAKLSEKRPETRLFFQGTKHPNPMVPEMDIVTRSKDLAAGLGVLNRQVFFNDAWVDYEDRQNYLLEADAGVSTHYDHLETTFSFRTRILDYLWAELPMVVTEGDSFADLVHQEQLGLVVPEQDVAGLARALERILFDERLIARCKKSLARVRVDFYWEKVLEPLVNFISDPPVLPRERRENLSKNRGRVDSMPFGMRRNFALLGFYWRAGGPGLMFRKIGARIRFWFRKG